MERPAEPMVIDVHPELTPEQRSAVLQKIAQVLLDLREETHE